MNSLNRIFAFSGCLSLALSSCVIEDEYSNPKLLEKLGTELTTLNNPALELFWSDVTDEIFIVTIDGIIAINAESKKERRVSLNNPYGLGGAWLSGETIFLMNYAGEMSAVDINSLSQPTTIVDSAFIHPWANPGSSTHLAYSKWTAGDLNEPSLFLFDLNSRKEMRIASGQSFLFSPDGNQLVFKNNTQFYLYDLPTTQISPLGIDDFNGSMILRWTTDGIVSFEQSGDVISVRNETTNLGMGQFKTGAFLYKGDINQKGSHIITSNLICAYPNEKNTCGTKKTEHTIVNIETKTQVPMIHTLFLYAGPRAISPDDSKFVYWTPDNRIFIAEPLN